MTDEEIQKMASMPITQLFLASLLRRALKGILFTKPGLKFTKIMLDCTTSKGRIINRFLANPAGLFPAKNCDERVKRIEYIFEVLGKQGVDVLAEFKAVTQDITANLEKSFPLLLQYHIQEHLADKTKEVDQKLQEFTNEIKSKIKDESLQLDSVITEVNKTLTILLTNRGKKTEKICGLSVGHTTKSTRLKNGLLKAYSAWYAYDETKKIYLGAKYDKDKFESILKKKGYPKKEA